MTSFNIPNQALEFRFVHASGPGGQHVNKTATAVELRVQLQALGLPHDTLRRLRIQQRNRINKEDELILQADQYRSQLKNRQDALQRLQHMLRQAAIRPKKRIPTKPSRAAKQRRMDSKKIRGKTKQSRRKPRLD